MPELPEVQTIVEDLAKSDMYGKRIVRADTDWEQMLGSCSVGTFRKWLEGDYVRSIERRGKFLVFRLSARYLILHLRMSGRINIVDSNRPRSKHEHLVLSFEDGRDLRMHDTRKFGRAFLVKEKSEVLGSLGVEPLSSAFGLETLSNILGRRKRMLKPLILDQHLIAGLGNIYTDESLWQAGLHPERRSCDLDGNEISALWRAIPEILRSAINNRGTSLGEGEGNYSSLAERRGDNRNHLNVYGRKKLPCKKCGTPIVRIIVAQRSTYLCPQCQPE